MINQAPIVRYMASVCEIFFADFCKKTFSAESILRPDPPAYNASSISKGGQPTKDELTLLGSDGIQSGSR